MRCAGYSRVPMAARMPEVDTDAIVRDIRTIAGIPAPTFAEGPRLEWLTERLAVESGELHRDAAGNLIWSWGEGRPVLR